MARAEYTDSIVNSEGHPVRGVVLKPETNVKVHAGSAGEPIFWAGESGPGTVASIKSDAQGFVQVWLTEGRYDITIPRFRIAKTIDLINQGTVAAGGGGGGVTQAEVKALVKAGPYATKVVTSATVPLGSVTGNLTPDMSAGDVFKGKSTGEVKLQTPSNFPSEGSKRRYIEVEIEGEHAITFPFLAGWRYGTEPPQDTLSSSSVNLYTFFSDDGTTWYGVGSEGLPSDVLRASIGVSGSVLTSDGEKCAFVTPTSSGQTAKQVEEAIEAFSIITGSHPTKIENAPKAKGLLVGTSGATAQYEDETTLVRRWAKPYFGYGVVVTGVETVTCPVWNRVEARAGSAGCTLILPNYSAGSVEVGAEIIIVNNSGGKVKVKGRTNLAEPTKTVTTEISPEIITYELIGAVEEAVWVPNPGYRSPEAVQTLAAETVLPGAWTNFASRGPHIEVGSGGYPAQSRLEQQGSNVRLRGVLAIEAGKTLKTNERLCTLKEGFRPTTAEVRVSAGAGGTSVRFGVLENGEVLLRSEAEIPAATTIWLDGVTFSIT